jgi:hypothetical protein
MGELEASRKGAGTSARVSAVLFVFALLVVLGGVCWCAYIAWHRTDAGENGEHRPGIDRDARPGPVQMAPCGRRRCVAGYRGGAEDRGFESYPLSGDCWRSGCPSSSYGGHRTPDALMRTGGSQN